jgi:hypothetical protein
MLCYVMLCGDFSFCFLFIYGVLIFFSLRWRVGMPTRMELTGGGGAASVPEVRWQSRLVCGWCGARAAQALVLHWTRAGRVQRSSGCFPQAGASNFAFLHAPIAFNSSSSTSIISFAESRELVLDMKAQVIAGLSQPGADTELRISHT